MKLRIENLAALAVRRVSLTCARVFALATALICLLPGIVSVAPAAPVSIWSTNAVPAVPGVADTAEVELGLKFQSATNGYITGLRFYKATNNTGTHVGKLWTTNGTLLASAVFSGETASGWQQQALSFAVPISSNTTYIASYRAPFGHYSADSGYFATAGVTNHPLRALSNAEAGGNGVFSSAEGAFPDMSFNATHYWVDVVFDATPHEETNAPVVIEASPEHNQTNVSVNVVLTVTFSEPILASTINSNTFVLRNATNGVVPATVSLTGNPLIATLTPTSPLGTLTNYTATLAGGTNGIADLATNRLASDFVWSFTTAPPDSVPPLVSSVSPMSGIGGVSAATAVTVTFSEAMKASTIGTNTVKLRDAADALVPAAVTYDSAARRATLTPASPLATSSNYTATVSGGAGGAEDLAGNLLATNYSWSFTVMPANPYGAGPGGRILLITATTNPITAYYAEILQTEGFNAFALRDISTITTTNALTNYDIAILGEMTLTTNQTTTLSNWVVQGGKLIAMRPDKKLAPLLGLTDLSATLSEGYVQMNPVWGPGAGIEGETMQFHGIADRYALTTASNVATLYTNTTVATTNPAVTMRSVGSNGGYAAAFTYDLARSVVLTRQGNPAWVNQERDGLAPLRSDDLFYGAASFDPQPNYVNLDKVAIPQADEQQRLLANLIIQLNIAKRPLPRFWYFPDEHKAVVVMTGDDHANAATAGRFDQYIAYSPTNGSVSKWETVRGSSYVYHNTPISGAAVLAYQTNGFEIALHVNTGCANYTRENLETFFTTQLALFQANYPGVLAPTTLRTHCIAFTGYTLGPEVGSHFGIRLDVNYYYWPPGWVVNKPGVFTGSAMPMRFATLEGNVLDVFQAATQLTDESNQTYPFTIDTLLDRALGTNGYYGAYVANMHTDVNPLPQSDSIVTSCLNRGVPVITARQLLDWVDARNASTFTNITWTNQTLTFAVVTTAAARGLTTMVPVPTGYNPLNVRSNGVIIAHSTEHIKGIQYALFPVGAANYTVNFEDDTTPPVISATSPTNNATGVARTGAVSVTFNEAMNAATITTNTFTLFNAASNPVPATLSYAPGTFTATLQPVAALGSGQNYTVRVLGGGGGVKDAATNALAADYVWSFTTSGQSLWSTSATPAILSESDTGAVELGLKFQSAVAGYVTGVRFYKGTNNPGPHVGNLWTLGGSNLASVPFSSETTNGWQQQLFVTPVPVASNTTYVVSYFAPTGGYSKTLVQFSSGGVTNDPLRALSNVEGGGNGVFSYGATSLFPVNSGAGANYWVDLVFQETIPPDTTAPTVVTVNPASGATNVSDATSVTVTFNEAVNPATLTASNFTLFTAASNPVPASISYNAGNFTATLQPSNLLDLSQTYTVRVKGGAGGVADAASNALAADYVWSFTTAGLVPLSLWSNSVIPTVQSENDPSAYELGLKFQSLTAGYVTGVRFYKGTGNTNTHTGRLWNSLGTNLATVTFSNETATGWQEQLFSTPVAITSNTTYVISYSAPNGGYAADYFYFASTGYTNHPLRALSSPEAGGNGVFNTTLAAFPTTTVNAANYWVDLVFQRTAGSDTTAPTVVTVNPPSGATNVNVATPVTVTFSEAMNAATITTNTFKLFNAESNLVPATLSYTPETFTATLQPVTLLGPGQTYSARVVGGGGGVKDASSNALAADHVWSFITAGQPPVSLWTNATPAILTDSDSDAVELGLKFRSAAAGYVTGVRFYKGTNNPGPHVGNLWTLGGSNLASVVFSNETATGWQEQLFVTPVPIASNTTYVVSYFAPNGGYSINVGYFSSGGVTNDPLRALSNAEGGGNGVFTYNATSAYPTDSGAGANYWVDLVYQKTIGPPAPTVVTVSPADDSTNVSLATPVTVTFSEAMNPATLTTSNFTLFNAATNPVPASISYNSNSFTATLQPSNSLELAQTYTARVKGGAGGVTGLVSNALAADYVWSFATVSQSPVSLWSNSVIPAVQSVDDPAAYELGLKFQSLTEGYVTGVRFYKGPTNTGTHVGRLWNSLGTNLATVTFSNETATGWQEQMFPTPVAITSNTTYVISYSAPNGGFARDQFYFSSTGYTNHPLRALSTGEAGGNGVFNTNLSAFPVSSVNAANYWVDVLFLATAIIDTTVPTVVSVTPTNGTTGIGLNAAVTVTFDENMASASLNASNFTLVDAASNMVPASISYNAGTFTATLQPSNFLAVGQAYTARVKGGAGGVTDLATNALAADYVWSFTTIPTLAGSIWSNSIVPVNASFPDPDAYSLGVKFQSELSGFISGIRFYKGTNNTGPHVGSLWTLGGSNLATVDFTGETAEGWQQQLFTNPVPISAGTTYVASYHCTNGGYAVDIGYFNGAGYFNYPLRALTNSEAGGNGVFTPSLTNIFPATGSGNNYWVDVVYDTGNTPPTATNMAVTILEDSSTNLVLLGSDAQSAVTYSIITNPPNGALTSFNTNTGAITYRPNTNYFGADAFTYRVSDGSLLATGTVSVTVSAVNDRPVATNFAVTLPEDNSTNLTLLGGDVESAVTYSIITNPPNGTLTGFNTNTGALTYRPNTNYFGADAFTYRVSDGSLLATGMVSVTVSAVNDRPVATNFAVTLPEDTTTNLTLLGGDVESAVTYSIITNPPNGALTSFNTNTGAITYRPNTNYFGADAFTYRVSDGSLLATGTVSVTVSAVNDRPVATNFAVTLPEDTTTNLTLLGGDVETAVTYSLVANPTNGTLTGFNTNTGALTYQPNTNYFGADTFRYRVSDGSLFATGTVSMTVSPVNDRPTVTNFAVTLPEDSSTNLTLLGGDVESAVTYSIITNPPNGVLTGFNTNTGAITYTPTNNYFGADAFTYRVSDGSLLATGTVSMTVSAVNDAPTATNFAVTLPEDASTNLTLLGGDVENAVTYSLVANPTNGTLTGFNTNTGAITYTPTNNYFGADAFTYRVSDGSLLATGTVSVTVSAVNDAPVATNFVVTLPEDSSTNLTLLGGDVENAVTYSLVANPTNGTLTGFNTNTGAITYTPTNNYFGADAFSYRVSDGSLLATGTVSITVIAVDDPPVFVGTPTNRTVPELTLLTVTNSATDVDTLSNALTYVLVNAPTNAVIDTNGVIAWVPGEAQGPSSNVLTTVVSDGVSSVTNSFEVIVTEVNAPPVVANPISTQSGNYGSNYSFTFPTNTFVDPEAGVLTYTATNLPPGISFSGPTRTFSGTPTATGSFQVSLVATDDGLPALSATNVFNINIALANLLITAGDTNKSYGTSLMPTQYSVSGLLNSDSVTNVTLSSAGSVSNAAVGSYAITPGLALGLGLTNYNIGYSNGTLTVGAANLLVTAGDTNKVYGATLAPTQFSVAGLLNSDSVTNVTLSSAGSVSNAAVGSYAITPGLALGVGLTNYVIGYSNGTLTVGAANLLVTAGSTNKVYGATLNPAAYSVSGLLNGDSVTNVTLTSSGSATNAPVGSYAITPSLALGLGLTNYNIGYSNGTLTVGAANLLVTAGSTNKVYGATLNPAAYSVSGLLNGDSVTNVTLSSAGSVSNAVVGSYAITPSLALGLGLTNYVIGYSNGTLAVGAANLLVTAGSTNKVYGVALTPTQFSVTGLLNSDSVTNVTLTSSGSPTNAAVGSYAITPSLALGLGLTNYNIGYSNGTLTVGAANLLITAGDTNKSYGTTLNPAAYSVSGLLNGDSVTNVTLSSAGSVSNAAVGSYAITPSLALGLGLTNYNIGYSNGTLAVGAANLLVTAGSTNKVYGATLTPTQFSVSGLLNSDSVTNVTLTSSGSATNAAVGNYAITPSLALGLGLTNYNIGYSNGTLNVTAAGLLITANDTNKGFGSTLVFAGNEFVATGLLNGDSVTNVALASAGAAAGAAAGVYPITVTNAAGSGLSNYTIGYVAGTLTVTNTATEFIITSITVTNGVATITWNSTSNLSYVLQYKDNLTDTNWTDVPPAVIATGPSTSTTNELNGMPQRFYRVRLGTTGAPVPAPVIQSLIFDSGAAVITWTSVNGQAYRLQYKTNLLDVSWTSVAPDVTAPGPTTTLTNLVGDDPQRFFRVMVP